MHVVIYRLLGSQSGLETAMSGIRSVTMSVISWRGPTGSCVGAIVDGDTADDCHGDCVVGDLVGDCVGRNEVDRTQVELQWYIRYE